MRERKCPPTGSALNSQTDSLLDAALADTFPASDPVAFITPLTALGSALSSAGEQQSVSWSGFSF